MIVLLVIVFVVTVLTGPAGKEYLNRRKQLRERPLAKVIPLPYPSGHPKKL